VKNVVGSAGRYLPASPPLPLSTFFDRKERAGGAFPFSSPRGLWYYLGRNALWHGLHSLRLDEGDEVLVPAYNSGAEVDAIVAAGLTPRFFRIGADLMPELHDMQSRVSLRSRALLVIHYFGFPQPLADLAAFCVRNGLLLIEDCAPALFSRDGDVPLGTTGVFSVFSPHKTLPLPHGGFLVVNDARIALPAQPEELPPSYGVELLPRRLLQGVQLRHPDLMRWARRTFGFQLGAWNDLNGPSGSSRDETFDRATARLGASAAVRELALRPSPALVVQARRRNYRLLSSLLPREDQLLADLRAGICPLFLPFFVADAPAAIRRLKTKGIELFPYWSTPHPAIPAGAFPEAEYLRAHLLALPVYQGLEAEDIEFLADAVLRSTPGRGRDFSVTAAMPDDAPQYPMGPAR
jgi:perosamine synthetase